MADDAVTRYCEASIANDIDRLLETLAPDIEVVSPLSGRLVFRGHDDVGVLLAGVYRTLRDWRWGNQVGNGDERVVIGRGRIAGLPLDDAMLFELGTDGRIRRIRPHLRPWLGTTAFALILGCKLARYPSIIQRALSG